MSHESLMRYIPIVLSPSVRGGSYKKNSPQREREQRHSTGIMVHAINQGLQCPSAPSGGRSNHIHTSHACAYGTVATSSPQTVRIRGEDNEKAETQTKIKRNKTKTSPQQNAFRQLTCCFLDADKCPGERMIGSSALVELPPRPEDVIAVMDSVVVAVALSGPANIDFAPAIV